MSADAGVSTPDAAAPIAASAPFETMKEVIYRHTFLVRLTHWVNAVTIFVMIGTGLNIFNAHPLLYWGEQGNNWPNGGKPLINIHAINIILINKINHVVYKRCSEI